MFAFEVVKPQLVCCWAGSSCARARRSRIVPLWLRPLSRDGVKVLSWCVGRLIGGNKSGTVLRLGWGAVGGWVGAWSSAWSGERRHVSIRRADSGTHLQTVLETLTEPLLSFFFPASLYSVSRHLNVPYVIYFIWTPPPHFPPLPLQVLTPSLCGLGARAYACVWSASILLLTAT